MKNIFKRSRLKLCVMTAAGIILSAFLIGCTSNNDYVSDEEEENIEEIVEEKEPEIATVNLEYLGLENIPEKDIIIFINMESKEMSAIAATDHENRQIILAPGKYAVASEHIEMTEFEILDAEEVWNVQADYNTMTFTITQTK